MVDSKSSLPNSRFSIVPFWTIISDSVNPKTGSSLNVRTMGMVSVFVGPEILEEILTVRESLPQPVDDSDNSNNM